MHLPPLSCSPSQSTGLALAALITSNGINFFLNAPEGKFTRKVTTTVFRVPNCVGSVQECSRRTDYSSPFSTQFVVLRWWILCEQLYILVRVWSLSHRVMYAQRPPCPWAAFIDVN